MTVRKFGLKECSGQYSVLILLHIVTGNENLCKIYLKKQFFQNVLVFIDLFFYRSLSLLSHLLRLYVTSCVYNMYTNSIIFTKSTEKLFFSIRVFSVVFTGKNKSGKKP